MPPKASPQPAPPSNDPPAASSSAAGSASDPMQLDGDNNNGPAPDSSSTPATSTNNANSNASQGMVPVKMLENMLSTFVNATTQGQNQKAQHDALIATLKKQTSKQFVKQMYLLQRMVDKKATSAEIVKVIDVYYDWIKLVEEHKGKVKEANTMMCDKLRKVIPRE